MAVAWQPTLLGGGEPHVGPAFAGLVRLELDELSWVDHVPGWLDGADTVFDALVERARWRQEQRLMYGDMVDQPRLTASWRDGAKRPLLPVLGEIRDLLSARYGVEFDSGGLNLYRDGRDSVAWHRDRIAKEIVDPVVGIVSVGAPRTFRMRRRGGGTGPVFRLGAGDLLVTGGRTQRDWEHTVPKVASAAPRISITFRHSHNPEL